MNKRFSLWLECGIEAQVPTVKQCIAHLAPHVGSVYVAAPFLDGVLKPLAEWMCNTYPWLPFHGGIFASKHFDGAPLTDAQGWARLRDAAHLAQSHTGSSMVLVDCETKLEEFNAGRTQLDLAAVEAAIRQSGIRDSGIDFVFYATEVVAENPMPTYDLSRLLAQLFPTARAMSRNYGKLSNRFHPDYQRCEQAMLAAWGPNRLIHRMLIQHPDSGERFYLPKDVVAAAEAVPGDEISVWLYSKDESEFPLKPEIAAAVAAAFEAAGVGR